MIVFDKKNEKWWFLVLSALIFFSFYFALGAYPLLDNNEGLYASIAKNMLLSKEFIIPHLNCVPYIEKPPFLYWLISASFSLFGFTASAARLVTSSSAALMCVAMVYLLIKIKQPQAGMIAGVIFASSVGVSIIARMVYFDMLFTFLIGAALLSFFYWYETSKKNILRLGYIFFGLAVLTKGLVACILICGSVVMFLAWEGNIKRLLRVLDPVGIALFFAVVLPWHIAAIIKHDGFARQYLFEEHFLRFLDQREPHDYYHGPIYYYLPRIIVYMFPWSLFMPLIFWRCKETTVLEQTLLRFCWSWLLVSLMFFSLSSAKANYYMIVGVPAVIMILGIKLKYLFATPDSKTFNIWTSAIFFLIAIGFGVVYFFFADGFHLEDAAKRLIMLTAIYGLIAGFLAASYINRKDIVVVLLASFIIPVVVIGIYSVNGVKNDRSVSAAKIGVYLSEHAKNKPLYIYQDFEDISALAFYAPSCFKIIESRSNDLYYGEHLPKFQHLFLNREKFLQEAENKEVYVVVPEKKLLHFYQKMLPLDFYSIKNFGSLVVVSNH